MSSVTTSASRMRRVMLVVAAAAVVVVMRTFSAAPAMAEPVVAPAEQPVMTPPIEQPVIIPPIVNDDWGFVNFNDVLGHLTVTDAGQLTAHDAGR